MLGRGSVRNVISLSGGAAGGQLLGILSVPVIARLFSPEEFGVYATVLAFSLVIASFSTLKLDAAIPLPEDDAEASHLFVSSAIIAFGLGLSLGIASLIFVTLSDDPTPLESWFWVAPLAGASLAVTASVSQLMIRQRRFVPITVKNFGQPAAMLVLQVVLGVTAVGGGLVIGMAGAYVMVAVTLLCFALSSSKSLRAGYNLRPALLTVCKYKGFVTYHLPAAVLNSVGLQIPVVLLISLYGAELGGLFGMTQRVLALPISLIGLAIGQVYLGDLAAKIRADNRGIYTDFIAASRVLVVVAVPIVVSLVAVGPGLFQVALGAEWKESGEFARIMAFALGCQIVASPLTQAMVATQRLRLLLVLDATRLILVCLALLVPGLAGADFTITIIVYTTTLIGCYLAYWFGARYSVLCYSANA